MFKQWNTTNMWFSLITFPNFKPPFSYDFSLCMFTRQTTLLHEGQITTLFNDPMVLSACELTLNRDLDK